ncbi:MAG: LysR family transcriptional regulator [Rhizobiaceae bacterium]
MRLSDRVLGVDEFLAVAEALSFVGAAEKLGLTASAVGKAVQRLERRLGVRLFARTTRRVTLTEEGALFRERCVRFAIDFSEAEAEVDSSRTSISGMIRISAPVAYGRIKIIPPLVAFMKAYPDVQIDLRLSDQLIDPVEDRIDLMVRIGELEDSSMWAKRIDTIHFGIFASPAYLEAHGEPTDAAALLQHERLGFIRNTGKPLAFTLTNKAGLQSVEPTGRLMSNDIEGTLAAAQQGLGLVYLPTFLASPAVTTNTLKPVLKTDLIEGPPVHLIHLRPRQIPKRVKALADKIVAEINGA